MSHDRSESHVPTHRAGASILILLLAICGALAAEQAPLPPESPEELRALPLDSTLYRLDTLVNEREDLRPRQIAEIALDRGMNLDRQGRVNVEIIDRGGSRSLPAAAVTPFGGAVDATWRNRVSAWVPPGRLVALARSLPLGYFVYRAQPPNPDDEGPGVVGSDDYIDDNVDGDGIRVGIIDQGYNGLTNAQGSGNAPASYTAVNYTGSAFESGTDHGTDCVEQVFDHAPDATYFIYRIANLTHVGNAVDHAVTNDLDVLSMSQSWYNEGWADDTGAACAAAETAHDNGILFFNSAGNRAQQHWQGDFFDDDADSIHDWVAGDEGLDISLGDGGKIWFYLSWDTSGGTYDHNLYLYDSGFNNVLRSSTNSGETFEAFTFTNNSGATNTYKLVVTRVSGGTTEFEVFGHGPGSWQFSTAAGSVTSPSNCTYPNVVSVAAVDQADFTDPAGSNVIKGYSSRGPTNSGNQAPDIAGPTDTTVTGGGSFGGTSSATPNAAGAAATFWSSALSLSATGVRHLMLEKAEIFKDWGANGVDTTYGKGGVALHEYHPGTIWADKDAGNILGFSTLPYYYLQDAYDAAADGGRIVFLGDHYDHTLTMSKDILLQDIGNPALLGNN